MRQQRLLSLDPKSLRAPRWHYRIPRPARDSEAVSDMDHRVELVRRVLFRALPSMDTPMIEYMSGVLAEADSDIDHVLDDVVFPLIADSVLDGRADVLQASLRELLHETLGVSRHNESVQARACEKKGLTELPTPVRIEASWEELHGAINSESSDTDDRRRSLLDGNSWMEDAIKNNSYQAPEHDRIPLSWRMKGITGQGPGIKLRSAETMYPVQYPSKNQTADNWKPTVVAEAQLKIDFGGADKFRIPLWKESSSPTD